jgi:hypothetical protein
VIPHCYFLQVHPDHQDLLDRQDHSDHPILLIHYLLFLAGKKVLKSAVAWMQSSVHDMDGVLDYYDCYLDHPGPVEHCLQKWWSLLQSPLDEVQFLLEANLFPEEGSTPFDLNPVG